MCFFVCTMPAFFISNFVGKLFQVAPYQEVILVLCNRCLTLKNIAQFLFPKPVGDCVKVLTVHLYIRGVKYFLTVLYGQLASFFLKKTEVFLKLTMLLSLRNNYIMTTVITFSESASRIKVILYWIHFSWTRQQLF